FPGQYYDAETQLHHNYYRDYEPHTGRYLQEDPIGLAGGLNAYAYVNGMPLNYLDPLGQSGIPICNKYRVWGGDKHSVYHSENMVSTRQFSKFELEVAGPSPGLDPNVYRRRLIPSLGINYNVYRSTYESGFLEIYLNHVLTKHYKQFC